MHDLSELEPDSLLLREDWLRALALDLAGRERPPNGESMAAWRLALQTATPRTGRLLSLFGRRRVIRSPKGRRIVGAGEHPFEGLPTATGDVPERLLVKRRVISALFALTEPYRTTVLLRYVEGLDEEAIAERTLASHGAVQSRLRRGLGHVTRRLAGSSSAVQHRVFETLIAVAYWPVGHRPQPR